MRFILLITILLMSFQPIFADEPSSPVPDSVRIERLAGLCELWGVVKYFHPYLAYKDIDWDNALIKTIPKVNKAETPEAYRRAIQHMISFLQDPNTYIVDENYEFPRAKISDLMENDWSPRKVRTNDSIAIIVAGNFDGMEKAFGDFYNFPKFINSATKNSKGVIIDARCLIGPTINIFSAKYEPPYGIIVGMLSCILSETIYEPSFRSRIYSDHISREHPWGWHESGFLNRFGYCWNPDKEYPIDRMPVIFIINEGSADLLPILGALQDKNIGAIIYEGPFDRDGGIETYNVKLPEEVSVEVRLTEIVKSDGTEAVHPNIVIPYTTDTTLLECPPIRTAIDIINGRREIPPGVARALPLVTPRIYEKIYGDMPAPELEYRLFTLFKFWNEIKYFYPYLDEMDQSWRSVLVELIPWFEAGVGETAYRAAIEKMTNKSGGFFAVGLGNSCYPSFTAESIEGQTVVTYVGNEDSSTLLDSIEVGDVILEINGEDVIKKRKQLAGSISEPTPQALQSRVNNELLGSKRPSPINLSVRKADGRVESYNIPRHYGRYLPFIGNSDTIAIRKIGDNIVYISEYIEDSLKLIMDANALILDLRSRWPQVLDPSGHLARIINKQETSWCLTRKIARYSPDPDKYSWDYERFKAVPDDKYHYRGIVVALINAETSGLNEEKCLLLDAVADVVFIGIPTEGGFGGQTEINLPGEESDGIEVIYIGIDVRYPDDTPVYGVGIQPDILVEPTIEGIRQGRDEILEAAIEYLEKELEK